MYVPVGAYAEVLADTSALIPRMATAALREPVAFFHERLTST